MEKFNVAETNTCTPNKIKTEAKKVIMDAIFDFLVQEYGEDSVSIVRVGNGDSKSKEIAVLMGAVDVAGKELPMTVCIKVTGKNYRDVTSAKGKVTPAFNFNVEREAYNVYLEGKAQEEKTDKETKSKKIAKDKAARESLFNFEDF